MAHLHQSSERVSERVAHSRHAARSAAQETIALRAAVDQRLAESSDCLRTTADLLSDLRRRLRP